ncbi:MAG: hypothetical protein ACYC3I_22520, partial [Gemmataceae bacterium]
QPLSPEYRGEGSSAVLLVLRLLVSSKNIFHENGNRRRFSCRMSELSSRSRQAILLISKVAAQYAQVVDRLIGGGKWKEMPVLEGMLPDEWMPTAFFKFWSIFAPHDPDGR